MPGDYSILVVDDEESIRRLLLKELAAPHRRVKAAASAGEAMQLCRQDSFEVILLDIRLRDGNGLELLPLFLRLLPDAKIIMITGYADVDGAVTAMRYGAYDFVSKPFTLDKLELLVDRAFEHASLKRENRSLRLSSAPRQHALVGHSGAIRQISYLLEKVAPTDIPVLITGESGTGKDVVAAEIHRVGKRASLPFVVKNCAGLQKELARSELFGHVKGAFTNALESSEGLMIFANRGTLFLDEVGELPLEVQAQLLRVLESRRYRRVGEKEERSADVRFIFATNRNLALEVRDGRFHEAFFHRINVFQIILPPLKERRDDIHLLVPYFLARLAGEGSNLSVDHEAMQCLLRYHWPGNVRELRNVIERGIILAENGVITERALPRDLVESVTVSRAVESIGGRGNKGAPAAYLDGEGFSEDLLPENMASHNGSAPPAGSPAGSLRLEDIERNHIARVLAIYGGNKQQAARALGIARKTLYRKIENLGLE